MNIPTQPDNLVLDGELHIDRFSTKDIITLNGKPFSEVIDEWLSKNGEYDYLSFPVLRITIEPVGVEYTGYKRYKKEYGN